jgi:hypothetical protein
LSTLALVDHRLVQQYDLYPLCIQVTIEHVAALYKGLKIIPYNNGCGHELSLISLRLLTLSINKYWKIFVEFCDYRLLFRSILFNIIGIFISTCIFRNFVEHQDILNANNVQAKHGTSFIPQHSLLKHCKGHRISIPAYAIEQQ